MNCSKAHEYFIKHMDEGLSGMESEWLDNHLMKCEKCREDFVAYEAVLGAMLEELEMPVPDDLEIKIMEQICDLSPAKSAVDSDDESKNIRLIIGVAFVVIMALVPIVIMKWDGIIELQSIVQNTYFDSRLAFIEHYEGFAARFATRIHRPSDILDALFARFRYFMMIAIAVLVFIQLAIWKKHRTVGQGDQIG